MSGRPGETPDDRPERADTSGLERVTAGSAEEVAARRREQRRREIDRALRTGVPILVRDPRRPRPRG